MNELVDLAEDKYTLTDEELLSKVDKMTDEIFKTGKFPSRSIPARVNDDYDLLIGRLIRRFQAIQKEKAKLKAKLLLINRIDVAMENVNEELNKLES